MVCTASVPLIRKLVAAGELRASDIEGDQERITEEELLEQNINAYEDVVLTNDNESTIYSAEGTVMHEVREHCLNFPILSPLDFAGDVVECDGFKIKITEEMCDKLVAGIDWIREHTDNPNTEGRVDLGFLIPGQFGTCDAYWLKLIKPRKLVYDLYVSDLKFGMGEPVDAFGNRQLRFYALGAWNALGRPNIRKVILNIDQPRAGGMKFWEITFQELMEFAEEVRRVTARIENGDVEFVPSTKGCRWCPVRKLDRGCAAYNRWNLWMIGAAVMDPSSDPKFVDPTQMSRALRYYIVKNAAGIRSWLADCHKKSLGAAMVGDPDPGSKAVSTGDGRRAFKDESAAEQILVEALGKAAYKKKLIGFVEIDDLLKPGTKKAGNPVAYEKLERLVKRKPAPPKLVSADHPSPAYQRIDDDDFDDLPTPSSVSDDDFDDLD